MVFCFILASGIKAEGEAERARLSHFYLTKNCPLILLNFAYTNKLVYLGSSGMVGQIVWSARIVGKIYFDMLEFASGF